MRHETLSRHSRRGFRGAVGLGLGFLPVTIGELKSIMSTTLTIMCVEHLWGRPRRVEQYRLGGYYFLSVVIYTEGDVAREWICGLFSPASELSSQTMLRRSTCGRHNDLSSPPFHCVRQRHDRLSIPHSRSQPLFIQRRWLLSPPGRSPYPAHHLHMAACRRVGTALLYCSTR